MNTEHVADVSSLITEINDRSPLYFATIERIEAGLEASRIGGYAVPKIEGKSLGRWLSTNFSNLGLGAKEAREIIDIYVPPEVGSHQNPRSAMARVSFGPNVVTQMRPETRVFEDTGRAAGNDKNEPDEEAI